MSNDSQNAIPPRLGLWDAVSIIIGIVVGTSIFVASPMIFQNAGGPWAALGLWALGGVVAWCGAVCYAELATTYPRDGGDYEYLNRAFGSWCGFLFSWAQITVIISGNIAIMAYAFADYGAQLWSGWNDYAVWLTIAPVVVLSLLNACGMMAGKVVQNVLTASKVLGLAAIVVAAFAASTTDLQQPRVEAAVPVAANIGIALVFVLYAYGGWAHAAYVAAEVRDQRRNLPRALILGIVCIAVIYLAVNAAYLAGLGFDGAQRTSTPAADVMSRSIGPWAGRAISLLVMLSALGAINGMILTGTRIYAVWGADYPALAWLGAWNRRSAAPLAAIALQGAVAAGLILIVGTEAGRNYFDHMLRVFGIEGLPWKKFNGGFNTLVAGSAPVYWALTFLTALSVFILRFRNRAAERPFTIPLFPLPAIVFCASCVFMFGASLDYARWLSLIGFVPIAIAAVLWFALRRKAARR
jgi:basic amino acid/polyamine antiporter, APA family